jgi:hypothetical protein
MYGSVQQLCTDGVGMATTLFVPFIPILFIHFSVAELLQKIIRLLA